jgi:hypothetical protein
MKYSLKYINIVIVGLQLQYTFAGSKLLKLLKRIRVTLGRFKFYMTFKIFIDIES